MVGQRSNIPETERVIGLKLGARLVQSREYPNTGLDWTGMEWNTLTRLSAAVPTVLYCSYLAAGSRKRSRLYLAPSIAVALLLVHD